MLLRGNEHRMLTDTEGTEQTEDGRRLGGGQGERVNEADLVISEPCSQRHPRRGLKRLAWHPEAEIAGTLGKDVTAATTRTTPPTTGTGVPCTFLTVELLCRPSDLTPRLGTMRPLTEICLVHHHSVVQELLVDRGGKFRRVDFVRPDLLTTEVIHGEIHFAPAFFLETGAPGPATFLIRFVCWTITIAPLGPGTAPRTSKR